MVSIAVVEDSQADSEAIRESLNKFAEEENIKISVDNYESGLEFLETYNSVHDIILLDINMPHMNGLMVAKKVRSIDPEVPLIFITSMAKCAINGYEVDALAFILKPIVYADFERAMKKAIKYASTLSTHLIVKTGGKLKRINISDICFIEVQNNTIYINMTSGEVLNVRSTLTEIENKIAEGRGSFVRCNNCYLVNLMCVTDVFDDTVVVGNTRLAISRHKKKEFLDALTAYYGRR
jgi:DNA-binding LytR/AlgR family response regulator